MARIGCPAAVALCPEAGEGDAGIRKDSEELKTQIDAIFAAIVDVSSTKAPGMKRVAPSDPEMSFLMHKLDNTLDCPLVECSVECGLPDVGCGITLESDGAYSFISRVPLGP